MKATTHYLRPRMAFGADISELESFSFSSNKFNKLNFHHSVLIDRNKAFLSNWNRSIHEK